MTKELQIQKPTELELYLKEIQSYPVLSPEEERRIAIKYYETKDVDLAKTLVTANLRFVVKIAHEYAEYGFNIMDLIQEGTIGLMMAVKKFNPYKNYRLISYAVWWIRAYIQAYIMNNYSLIKVGTTQNQRKLFYNLGKIKRELEQKNIEGPTVEAIAEILDVKPVEVTEMELRLSGRDFSLEYTSPETEQKLLDVIPDTRENYAEKLEEEDERLYNAQRIKDALSKLNEKERFVIERRILDENPKTLQEVGDELGITRERVRQIEEKALKKLKTLLSEKQDNLNN
ncbi:MAG: RNA polymerase factor sigma-32 [Proteobacteria bacterium]|nr:RNA polymerase factor sigma-32 [Pseudomonadota bacterium]